MKKVHVAALFAISLTMTAALPAEASLLLQSRVNAGADLQHIAPFIIVKEDNSTPRDISGAILTYYIYIGRLPIGWGTPTVTTLQGTPGATATISRLDRMYATATQTGKYANFALRIVVPPNTFVKGGVIGNPAQNYEISVSLADNASPHGNFDQTDDYSYLSNTTYGSNPYIMMQDHNLGIMWAGPILHDRPTQLALAKQKIQHVIIIMQENRSFDHYFGTFVPNNFPITALGASYGGVDGIANAPNGTGDRDGCSGTWNPVLLNGNDTSTADLPHTMPYAKSDMGCPQPSPPLQDRTCAPSTPLKIKDFLTTNGCGATTIRETTGHYEGNVSGDPVFNQWTIAKNFILQDKMFAPVPSYSLMTHLFLYSGWSADCQTNPNTCVETYDGTNPWLQGPFGWNDLSSLMFDFVPRVSWGLYKGENFNYACGGSGANETCKLNWQQCFQGAVNGSDPVTWFWAPLDRFTTVQARGMQANASQPIENFLQGITEGTIPKVSWIVPGTRVSEHPAGGDLRHGEAYATMILQRIMANSTLWNSSLIFMAWDDWGGFYDHVRPPKTSNGQLMYGIRVPGIAISPYVNNGGTLDHQTLSFDAYLKLIEDLFLQGTRVGGDGRSAVRENEPQLGDLLDEFDFRRTPLAPPSPVTGLSCQALQTP